MSAQPPITPTLADRSAHVRTLRRQLEETDIETLRNQILDLESADFNPLLNAAIREAVDKAASLEAYPERGYFEFTNLFDSQGMLCDCLRSHSPFCLHPGEAVLGDFSIWVKTLSGVTGLIESGEAPEWILFIQSHEAATHIVKWVEEALIEDRGEGKGAIFISSSNPLSPMMSQLWTWMALEALASTPVLGLIDLDAHGFCIWRQLNHSIDASRVYHSQLVLNESNFGAALLALKNFQPLFTKDVCGLERRRLGRLKVQEADRSPEVVRMIDAVLEAGIGMRLGAMGEGVVERFLTALRRAQRPPARLHTSQQALRSREHFEHEEAFDLHIDPESIRPGFRF